MSIRIITESSCDITKEEAEKLGVEVLPIMIRMQERDYQDGVDIDAKKFYEMMIENTELPKTSQITLYQYESAIADAAAAGDEVLIITLSSKLSGCNRNANLASQDAPCKVRVVDTFSASLGQGIAVRLACRYRDEGMSLDSLADKLEQEYKKIHVIALLDTLEYLSKGGRISKTAAFAGKMLSIKPVITFKDGEVHVLGKARGSRSGRNMLLKEVLDTGIDFTKPLTCAYSGFDQTLLKKYIEDSLPLYKNHYTAETLPVSQLGPTIGVYSGPGCIGFAWFGKE